MNKLGIRFCDNDFYWTIRNFLMLFGENSWHRKHELTKEDIASLFNHCAGSIYWISQNGKTYNDCTHNELPRYKYLCINEKDVFLDDEVTQFIKDNEWYNSEFQYIQFYANDCGKIEYIIKCI